MADVESNIKIGVDADQALRQLKLLQRQLSAFYSTMAKSGAAGAAPAGRAGVWRREQGSSRGQ